MGVYIAHVTNFNEHKKSSLAKKKNVLLYYPRNNNKYGGARDGALISPPYTCIMYSHINNTSI